MFKKSYVLLRAFRIRHYLKNILLLSAPLTGGSLATPSNLWHLFLAFFAFSFTASMGYLINDWKDREIDSKNPFKKDRAFASGHLSIWGLITGLGILLSLTLILCSNLPVSFSFCVIVYFLITLTYTLFFKHIPVLEMIVLTLGFVLRPLAGAAALQIPVSEWFLIVTSFGSLFMVATKRLSELKKSKSQPVRSVLHSYSESYLDSVISVSIAVALTAYSIWALKVAPESIWSKLSIVPTVTGLLRYSWLRDRGNAEAPELLILEDKWLPIFGLLAAACLGYAIYG